MLKLPIEKVYNAYLIETNDYDATLDSINNFLVQIGFDRELLLSNNHLDVYKIYEEQTIKVDYIRTKVVDITSIKPRIADKKVFIIYNAKNLNINAQNALLKTLEEPESYNIFFLITDNIKSLLDTIKSRCVCFYNNNTDEKIDFYYDIEFYNFLIKFLCDLKYVDIIEIDNIIEYISEDINNIYLLIKFLYIAINDVIIYKKTLDKNLIKLKKFDMHIITMANSFTFEFLGKFINDINDFKTNLRNNINVNLALTCLIENQKYNLLHGGNK